MGLFTLHTGAVCVIYLHPGAVRQKAQTRFLVKLSALNMCLLNDTNTQKCFHFKLWFDIKSYKLHGFH